jgi:hypothetical protein
MFSYIHQMDSIKDARAFSQRLVQRNGIFAYLMRATLPQTRFVPSALQKKIMKALDQRQLTTSQLEAEVGCDRKQLFGESGLKGLTKEGLVANNLDRKGYYRPDALPRLIDEDPAT